ncbi:MAG: ferrochelatase [Deltaproteobacteria bacterium]|nr:ferrochelatase [Nannocystaceae bacterium]
MSAPVGVLLSNLGTPEAPRVPEVRRYLRQFLSDPRVFDIPSPVRRAVLELAILPTRPAISASAYAKIWTEAGSPLLVNSLALRDAVAERLPAPAWKVALGMRYGEPALDGAYQELVAAGCTRIVVAPLYPQYAASSTGSTLEVIYGAAAQAWNTPALAVVPPFYGDARFIESFARVAEPVLAEHPVDHVLLSFHGLPERHMLKGDPSGAHCLASADCCDTITAVNASCYRAQCHQTARMLAARLGLADGAWSLGFQSRLGRTPWIKPYSDELLISLAERGVKRIAVMCPAFVADCLETLEEIGIRADEDWRARGGESLVLVPSLNATPTWVDTVVALVREVAGRVDADHSA